MTTHANGENLGAPELFSASDLHCLIERRRQETAAAERRQREAADAEKRHQEEVFLRRKLSPDIIKSVMARVHKAAEDGQLEIMLGQFPCHLCTDGGRMINAPEDGWPDTLQGIAKEFYEFWLQYLKPRGFHLRVQIISFPNGVPGDVGVFLSWGAPEH